MGTQDRLAQEQGQNQHCANEKEDSSTLGVGHDASHWWLPDEALDVAQRWHGRLFAILVQAVAQLIENPLVGSDRLRDGCNRTLGALGGKAAGRSNVAWSHQGGSLPAEGGGTCCCRSQTLERKPAPGTAAAGGQMKYTITFTNNASFWQPAGLLNR